MPTAKVLIYTTSARGVLVFNEPDFADVPYQVPGGTVEHGESLADAALREFREETGMEPASPLRLLGTHDYRFQRDGDIRHLQRSYFHTTLPPDVAVTWDHYEASAHDGSPPILFRFSWMDVPTARAELGLGMADFLDRLGRPSADR